jgi:hypothetical protein
MRETPVPEGSITRLLGCGGDSPRDLLLTHNQKSSGPVRRFPEKSETRTGDAKKFPAQPHKIFRKNPVRDPAIFKMSHSQP